MKVANAAITFPHRRIRRNSRDFTMPKQIINIFPCSAIALLNNGCSGTLISCKQSLQQHIACTTVKKFRRRSWFSKFRWYREMGRCQKSIYP